MPPEYEITVPSDDVNQMILGVGTDFLECSYVWCDVRMDHTQTGFRMPLPQAEEFLAMLQHAVDDARSQQTLYDAEGM